MNEISSNAGAESTASLQAAGGALMDLHPHNTYHVECWRRPEGCLCIGCRIRKKHGVNAPCHNAFLAWSEGAPNIVVDEGANLLLTQFLTGSSYTAAFYIGLISNTGFTALANSDTAAKITASANPPTTNGWQESNCYSNATRIALTLGAASARSINNSGAVAVFNINTTDTVYGFFLDTTSTIQGTSGHIYGEAQFTQGNRSVVSGDTLNVTVTCTA